MSAYRNDRHWSPDERSLDRGLSCCDTWEAEELEERALSSSDEFDLCMTKSIGAFFCLYHQDSLHLNILTEANNCSVASELAAIIISRFRQSAVESICMQNKSPSHHPQGCLPKSVTPSLGRHKDRSAPREASSTASTTRCAVCGV